MRELLTYGDGIPRYWVLWVPLTILLIAGLRAAGVRGRPLLVIVLSTLPTFALHGYALPFGVPHLLAWAGLLAVLVVIGAWLVAQVRGSADGAGSDEPVRRSAGPPALLHGAPVRWGAVLALCVLALVLRVPLAWLDPGIGDFAQASETAARQLLAGSNPYTLSNPYATYGIYQYPAASMLWHVPFVALLPAEILGEAWLPGRAAIWAVEVLAVVGFALAGAVFRRPRAGLVAAFAYAVHPTLVREAGMVVANDLLVALLLVGCALLLARAQPYAAGVALGIAISVKPSALVVLPVLALAGGLGPALACVAVPVVLQAPFLLLPSVGAQGLAAIAEPAARDETYAVLRLSAWWPAYATLGSSALLVRATAAIGILVSLASATWAGSRLRGRVVGAPVRAAAAMALPPLVVFALAASWRTTFQDWGLGALLLAAVWSGVSERPETPPSAATSPRLTTAGAAGGAGGGPGS